MTRLSDDLDLEQRSRLSLALASGVLDAVEAAGMTTIVITSDSDVAAWAQQHAAAVCDDPGTGLSAAAHAGVSMVGSAPWLMIHADLPLVTPHAISRIAELAESMTIIVPSYDGGTTVIAGHGTFPFAYGIGSFRRHYASAPYATVIVSPELSVDIDTELGLDLVPELLGGPRRKSVPLSRGTAEER